MRKNYVLLAGCVLSLGLSACTLNGNSIDVNITALPSPINVRVENDEYVYWDEVPNASSYTLKINNFQENTGNSLKYSVAAMMDSRIEYDVPTELHIFVKAKGNQILFSDSDWSQEYTYSYTKRYVDPAKTSLAVPTNIELTNGILTWSAVNNASSYKIQINNNTYDSASNFYNVSTMFNSTATFTVSVKSIAAANSSYKDSEWSEPKSFTYTFQSQTKFNAPENLKVESDIIKWDFVAGAHDYTVVINGDYKKVTEYNECRISDLISFSGSLTIKVKANAYNGVDESDWSTLSNYQYIVQNANEADVRLARNLSIGRGYNLIRDDYLDTAIASSNEVLDTTKLLTIGTLRTPVNSTQKYTMESTNDIDAFSTKTEVNFEYNSTKSSMLIGSLKRKIDINVGVDVKTYHYRQSVAADYTYTYKDVVIDNLGGIDRIATAVSDRFLDDINKRSNATRYFNDDQLIEYIYDAYGTHVILGVTTGASFHSNYSVVTNKYDVNVGVKAAYEQSAQGGSPLSIFDLQSSISASLSEDIGVTNENTVVNFDFYAYGGGAIGGYTKIDDLKSCLDNWANGVSEDNCRSIKLTKDGGISISNLLYELKPELAPKMEAYVSERGRIEYQSLLDKYYTRNEVDFGIESDGNGVCRINTVNDLPYSSNQRLMLGDVVEIEAIPNDEYAFDYWSNDYANGWTSDEKIYKVELVEDYKFRAHFKPDDENINVFLGSGTANDPYILKTRDHFTRIENDLTAYYKVGRDIDFGNDSWTPIRGTFSGFLDGNDHVLTNIRITKSATSLSTTLCLGLFEQVAQVNMSGGYIHDLHISSSSINVGENHNGDGYIYAGLVCGINNGIIDNCRFLNDSVSVARSKSNIGIIAGASTNKIENCVLATLNVTGSGNVGGVAGYLSPNASVISTIVSNSTSGNSYVELNATASGGTAGGIAGLAEGCTIRSSKVEYTHFKLTGTMSANPCMGIITGYQLGGYLQNIPDTSSTITKEKTNSSYKTCYFAILWGISGRFDYNPVVS